MEYINYLWAADLIFEAVNKGVNFQDFQTAYTEEREGCIKDIINILIATNLIDSVRR